MVIRVNWWKWYAILITFLFIASLLTPWQNDESQPVFYQQLAYKEYEFSRGGFLISFPATAHIQSDFWGGEEVLFNVRYFDPKYRYHGLVQKWQIRDLKSFVIQSKEHAQKIKSFHIEEVNLPQGAGYLVTYVQETSSGMEYVAWDLFIRGRGESVYRIVYFLPAGIDQAEHKKNFQHIVRTFKLAL